MDDFWGVFWLLFIIDGIVFASICSYLAREKGRNPGDWAAAGFFLGLVALLFLGFLPARVSDEPSSDHKLESPTKKCPACAEFIKLEALKCRFCGTEFDPAVVKQVTDRHEQEALERAQAAEQRREAQRFKDPYVWKDACKQGDVEKARKCLDAGAHPSYISGGEWAPLQLAVRSGNLNLLQLLLERGADPNCFHFPSSPLRLASEKGRLEMVKLLLERKARLNYARIFFGVCKELRDAARNGHLDIVRLLIESDAKTGGHWPGSAYRAALANGHTEVADFLDQVIVVEYARRADAKARRAVERERDKALAHSPQSGAATLIVTAAEKPTVSDSATEPAADADCVDLVCPLCNARLTVPRRYAGVTGKCNHCGGAITIAL